MLNQKDLEILIDILNDYEFKEQGFTEEEFEVYKKIKKLLTNN